jgi:hypothetical protein
MLSVRSRGSSVGVATGCGLGFDSRQGIRISVFRSVQNGSGTHSTSYPVGTDGSFLEPELELHHSHLVPRSRMMELYLHSLTPLHGVVIN